MRSRRSAWGRGRFTSAGARGAPGIEDGLGRCDEFEPKEHLSVKEVRRSDRFTQLALTAAGEALEDAGLAEEIRRRPGPLAPA